MNETVLHKLNTVNPLKTEYQISFIKHVLYELEKNDTEEIHDVIYEQIAEKLVEEKPEFSFKHFLLDDQDEAITIKESNSFIRDGTTGLKLWPAAMALGDFVQQEKEMFDGKSILEIGSGNGFVGFVLAKACQPKRIILSDCHESVLENLIENVNLNLPKEETEEMERTLMFRHRLKTKDEVEIGVIELPWEEVDKNEVELRKFCKPNILLASDVVYDDSIFDALMKCVNKLFELFGKSLTFFLSQTIRNEETFIKFCNLLHDNNFSISEEKLKTSIFFNVPSEKIKILRINLCNKKN